MHDLSESDGLTSVPIIMLAGQKGIPLQVLYGAAAIGAKVHVIGGPQAAYLRWSRHVASFTMVTLPPIEAAATLVAHIEHLAQRLGKAVVLPGDDYGTSVLARIAPQLSVPVFPCPSASTFVQLADKWKFHELCIEAAVPVPETLWIGDQAALDPHDLGQRLGYPLIVKPIDQGNMNGVVLARSAEDLTRQVTDDPSYRYGSLIAQSYIPGYDVDCSVLARDGQVIALAVQRRIGRRIVFLESPPLADYVKRLIQATQFSGLAHFDARCDSRDGRIVLIECNPRVWASIDAARCCGLNFIELGMRKTPCGAAPRVLAAGEFTPWSGLLLGALRLDFGGFRSAASWRGLVQAVTDPLPALTELPLAIRRRWASRNLRT